MSRFPLITPEQADGPTREFYQELRQMFHKVPNLFATIAHYPPAPRPVLDFFHAVYTQSSIPKRLLELAILRASLGLQSEYCLTLHKAFALEHGVSYDEIMSLTEDPRHTRFSEPERAILDYAAQFTSDARGVTDELFARIRQHFSEAEILNVSLLIGLAQLFGCLSDALQIPMDASSPVKQPG